MIQLFLNWTVLKHAIAAGKQSCKIKFAPQMWATRPHLASIFEKLLDQKTFSCLRLISCNRFKNNLLRKCGLLAHTSAAFLKNCCTEKLLFACGSYFAPFLKQKRPVRISHQTLFQLVVIFSKQLLTLPWYRLLLSALPANHPAACCPSRHSFWNEPQPFSVPLRCRRW